MAPIFNGPLANAARERFRDNHPVIAAVTRAAAEQIVADPRTSAERDDLPAIETAIETHVGALVVNATNREPPSQSRVITGTIPAVASALSTFLAGIAALFGALGPALALSGSARWVAIMMTVTGGVGSSGGLFALFGRLRRDLPPMTFKAWNPFSWFAPRPGTG